MPKPMKRIARTRQADPCNVPRTIEGEADLVTIDTTWGELQPLEPVPGVRTVGELELAEMAAAGAAIIDTRVPDSRSGVTIPGAVNIAHDEIVTRRDELDADQTSILFCNGPQCPQTPMALRSLLEAGYPASSLAYYRGGIHDWVSLAMPTEPTQST
jgi:rhodanese-related sulfurtransferase